MNRTLLSTPFHIGSLQFPNRLIQGPLAGVSAAPFRRLFYLFFPPAYTVTEMISAQDVLTKHDLHSRYLYRAAEEKRLCYQLAGVDPKILGQAAFKLQQLGADLIDINCGCPKAKIRKKGAGSALMDNPAGLCAIISHVREQIKIPLTVKLRIYGTSRDIMLAQMLEQAGADALIIHGRRWTDNYEQPCDFRQIALIKQHVRIPVIANGDIRDHDSLNRAIVESGADAYMISRAGCGQPWLYQQLLDLFPNATDEVNCFVDTVLESSCTGMYTPVLRAVSPRTSLSSASLERGLLNPSLSFIPHWTMRSDHFMRHVEDLCQLESEYQAVMQSKTLIRYYFRNLLTVEQLKIFYSVTSLAEVAGYLANTYELILSTR